MENLKERNFTVLSLDLVDSSKQLSEIRLRSQIRLTTVCEILNDVFKNDLFTNFSVLNGDSMQSVFWEPDKAFECFFLAKELLHPYQIHCGIGTSNLYSSFFSHSELKNSHNLVGKAFLYSDSAIKLSKESSTSPYYLTSNKKLAREINLFIRLKTAIERNLTRQKKSLFNLFYLFNPLVNNNSIISNRKTLDNYTELLYQNLSFYKKNSSKSDTDIPINKDRVKSILISMFETRSALKDSFHVTDINISILLGVTRQNISNMRRNGNFDLIYQVYDEIINLLANDSKQNG